MKRLLPLVLLACLGCKEDAPPMSSGESHWLDPCVGDADCVTGACICEICSAECASDDDCDGGTCEMTACGQICQPREQIGADASLDPDMALDARVDQSVPGPQPGEGLVINELGHGPTPQHHYVEIFNPTDAPIPLDGVTLTPIGAPEPAAQTTFDGQPALPPGRYLLALPADTVLDLNVVDQVHLTVPLDQVDGVALTRQAATIDSVVYRGTSRPDNRVGHRTGTVIGRCADGQQTGDNRVDFISQPTSPAAPNACPDACRAESCARDQVCNRDTGRCEQACNSNADCPDGGVCGEDCDDICDQTEFPNDCCRRYCTPETGTQWFCEAPFGACADACPEGTTADADDRWICRGGGTCCLDGCERLTWPRACASNPSCEWLADDCYPDFCSSANPGRCAPR